MELVSVAQEFGKTDEENTLANFLERVALVADIDDAELDENKVTLMTLHSSKGLEFPVVFLVGMEEGIFPHTRTLMNEDEVEEERRLCYVGITRAEKKLFVSNTKMRNIYGHTVTYPPSRFLKGIFAACYNFPSLISPQSCYQAVRVCAAHSSFASLSFRSPRVTDSDLLMPL